MLLHVRKARTLREKTIGLIGEKTAYPFLLKTRCGIHTFGLRFPIDIIVLDKNNAVVKIKKHLLPNSIFLWNPFFDTLIELPVNTLEKNNIAVGQKIDISIL